MRNIKKYKLNSDYTSNKDNFEYPTVSYVEENKEVYYTQKPPIVTYTTTGASQEIKLANKQEYLDYCKIVDTDEELSITGTGALNHTFENPGEHKVELKFKDDATTLASGFSGCSQLTSISENLFSNCTKVTNFKSTFSGCRGLTSIPANLFSNNTAVTDFRYTFENCSGLNGSVPVDSDGTPIYNRSGEGKEGYAIVTNYKDCFYQCQRLSDYSSIPEDWK